MAIVTNTYSGEEFEVFLAIQSSAMGTAEDTDADFVRLYPETVNDVDLTGGLVKTEIARTGQHARRPTDFRQSVDGATFPWSFEWVVNRLQGLNKLLQLISADATSPFVRAGNATPAVYADGESTGEYATVILKSPYSAKSRTIHSALLTKLSLKQEAGTQGGQLIASGEFYTGYNPTVGATAVDPSGTETAYAPTVFDLTTTKQIGSDDIVMSGWSLDIDWPAARFGFTSAGAPEGYHRGGYTVTGSIQVKYDSVVEGLLAGVQAYSGTTTSISLSNGSNFILFLPYVMFTDIQNNLKTEIGAITDLPFNVTATGPNSLYSITTA